MRKISGALILVAGAVSVAGCQSILGPLGLAKRPDVHEDRFGPSDLAEGRTALAANLPGNAIPAFQRATLNPETAAAAYNGLGVAYARLRRGDLAERFFTQATILDRENETYATNLTMFYASDLAVSTRTLAAREKQAGEVLAEAAVVVDPVEAASEVRTVANATITIERPRVRLSRAADREILVAAEARATPQARVPQVASSARLPAAGAGRSDAAAPVYPIRIDISRQVPKAAPRTEYPVRIALPSASDAN
jgi:hypothetical protein